MTPRLAGVHDPEVLEHAGGDADAGRREGRPQEQVHVPRGAVGHEDGGDRIAEGDGRDDPQHRDGDGGRADRQQLVEIALQPDLEQQQDHPDLGRDGQEGRGLQRVEELDAGQADVAEDDAEEQLAQHRGLVQPLHQLAPELRGHQDGGDGQQEGRHLAAARTVLGGAGRRPRAEDQRGDEEGAAPSRAAAAGDAGAGHAARSGSFGPPNPSYREWERHRGPRRVRGRAVTVAVLPGVHAGRIIRWPRQRVKSVTGAGTMTGQGPGRARRRCRAGAAPGGHPAHGRAGARFGSGDRRRRRSTAPSRRPGASGGRGRVRLNLIPGALS